ncbi:MAG: hypothetical protein J6V00_03330, partial [Bacteroidaceae bacterium]|nr:hypothetical protein [Bacteroidaceae bacterium]
ITTSLLADTNKLAHIGITFKIGRSTLADANKRRSESIFEAIYRELYARYKGELIPDSRSRKRPKWMDRPRPGGFINPPVMSISIFRCGNNFRDVNIPSDGIPLKHRKTYKRKFLDNRDYQGIFQGD